MSADTLTLLSLPDGAILASLMLYPDGRSY